MLIDKDDLCISCELSFIIHIYVLCLFDCIDMYAISNKIFSTFESAHLDHILLIKSL